MITLSAAECRQLLWDDRGKHPNELWDALYVHSPFCGTCQLAERMLTIVEQTCPQVTIASVHIQFVPDLVHTFQIESVPCLLIWDRENADVSKELRKIYAFHSVSYLYEQLRGGEADG
ncbi:thioredoxin family protein [Paenibacillus sp. MER TA 81-3]|uniref:thioredoxin family protein n=1 Tax=Paenibacillus sp. MER TA 81-3 TaxID=2939573 RepID=UPI00203FCE34|nr:thioredoxin family protein [Paenibacillus sp. MER TA 81-3]MCM3339927.1 thioredoxin family protein [Paenibacillus sp. MER TA 81-3]